MSKVKLLLDVVEDMRSLADSLQAVANAIMQSDEPEAVAEPPVQKEDPVPTIKLETLRGRLGEISRAGHTAEIHDLIQKYGATHLSKVDPKHYEALLRDAEVLGDAT